MLHACCPVLFEPAGEIGHKGWVGQPAAIGFEGKPLNKFAGPGILQQSDRARLNRSLWRKDHFKNRPPLGVEGTFNFEPVDPDCGPGIERMLGALEAAEIVGNVRPIFRNLHHQSESPHRLPRSQFNGLGLSHCALNVNGALRAVVVPHHRDGADRVRSANHAPRESHEIIAPDVGVTTHRDPLCFVQDVRTEIDAVIDPGVFQVLAKTTGMEVELPKENFGFAFVLEAHFLPGLPRLLHRHLLVQVGKVQTQPFRDSILGFDPLRDGGLLSGANGPSESFVRDLAAECQILFKVDG